MVSAPLGPLDHLSFLSAAAADRAVEQLDVFTLNHDVSVETALRRSGTRFSDGFSRPYGTLRIWNDSYEPGLARLFKLHGSVDWYRYNLPGDDWLGQVTARAVDDPNHAHGPSGEEIDVPAGRPEILTGTFNKILGYATGIYADQHYRFHESLQKADRLLVIGYGFRDKAINARIVSWVLGEPGRRMVAVHRDPVSVGDQARGAIRNKWSDWEHRGILRFVYHYLAYDTDWAELKSALMVGRPRFTSVCGYARNSVINFWNYLRGSHIATRAQPERAAQLLAMTLVLVPPDKALGLFQMTSAGG